MKNYVLILAGPPCSGKSSVGGILAKTGSIHVQVDLVLSLLLPESDRSYPDRLFAYRSASRLVRPIIESRRPAVLDCTYSRAIYREDIRRSCAGVPTFVVEFKIDAETALERFRARQPPHPAIDMTEQIVVDRANDYPFSDAAFNVDSTWSSDQIVARIDSWLAECDGSDLDAWVSDGL